MENIVNTKQHLSKKGFLLQESLWAHATISLLRSFLKLRRHKVLAPKSWTLGPGWTI